jgi:hypothetical protein
MKSNYYYETIQVNVIETGYYRFRSSDSIDTYGYIYEDNFNPLNPFENFLLKDDNSCLNGQFRFATVLQASTTYVLVVTTFRPNVTGSFSIIVSGPNKISLKHISEYLHHFVNTD